jgi:hypothetical protein
MPTKPVKAPKDLLQDFIQKPAMAGDCRQKPTDNGTKT